MMGNQMIGDFELVAKIGEGGMGEVFKGRDSMLERDVAIKSLRPELAARADILERFRTEAVALARLNHPNIAGVYRFFRHADQYYMVMEFVAGETLDQMVTRRGALPWQEALRYAAGALCGLEHAHHAGVVHRDIKPANMMVAADGTLKLMDFGIARILEKMRLTRSGHLIGTLEYMSPEQVQGREVDARSDLYSLAVVLFELLTARVPFSKGTDFELMKAQIEEPPPPLHRFAAGLPTKLEEVLARALAKDPSQRYPDAAAFRNALEALLSNEGLSSVPQAAPATRLIVTPAATPPATTGTAAQEGVAASGVGRAVGEARQQVFWRSYPGIVALVFALLVVGALAWWSGRAKTAAPQTSGELAHKPEASRSATVSSTPAGPVAADSPSTASFSAPALPASDSVRPATLPTSSGPVQALAPQESGIPATGPALPKPSSPARAADSGQRVVVRSSAEQKVVARSRAEPPPQASVRSDPIPPVVRREEVGSTGGWTIRK
ncbi:serine/threonine-protein kinase [Accumulibacter sp.]|uniref:serine/threonine-protein kinase n=1 Tax=Accumulibacter sp. TaxID=2053492 RepID=UPI0026189BD0|nr:serine/threonine-protein kinase [Accumulibacter sp.]